MASTHNTRIFQDLDLRFIAHPVTGDVPTLKNEDAIKASVRNLVMTNFYERRFHPEIGSQVTSLLFEPASMMTEILIKNTITETIVNYEPRVKLVNVKVISSDDNNTLYVSIEFMIVNTTQPITLNLSLKRSR
jgi:phage baseplate assembly protein W